MMPDFPEAVSNAIAAVMADIPKLAREETNKHANYKFASIDDFLDAVRPLCAKHKLAIVQDEASFTIVQTMDKYGKPSDWLQMGFAYTVATAGVSWGPVMRSIMVRADMGSQAFGAAQSYSLKQFMRSLFQISTGDGEDADSHEQSSIASAPVKAAFPDGPHKNKTALDTAITAFCTHIAALQTPDDVEAAIDDAKPTLGQYRRHYGAQSEHWEAIAKQLADNRARVIGREGLPNDSEPVPLEAEHVWSETTVRLVQQAQACSSTNGLNAWKREAKTMLDTLDSVEAAYVRGAVNDKAAALKAAEITAAG